MTMDCEKRASGPGTTAGVRSRTDRRHSPPGASSVMSDNPTSRPTNPRRLRCLALVVGVGLVAWGCDSKNSGGGKLTPVKGEGDPVVLLMKGDVPYITANVADDVSALKKAEPAAREEALIRKALQLVIERGLKDQRAT